MVVALQGGCLRTEEQTTGHVYRAEYRPAELMSVYDVQVTRADDPLVSDDLNALSARLDDLFEFELIDPGKFAGLHPKEVVIAFLMVSEFEVHLTPECALKDDEELTEGIKFRSKVALARFLAVPAEAEEVDGIAVE